MKDIFEYLSAPQNRTYVTVLSVTLIVLIVVCALLVLAYKRRKGLPDELEEPAMIDDKEIPENIVDDQPAEENESPSDFVENLEENLSDKEEPTDSDSVAATTDTANTPEKPIVEEDKKLFAETAEKLFDESSESDDENANHNLASHEDEKVAAKNDKTVKAEKQAGHEKSVKAEHDGNDGATEHDKTTDTDKATGRYAGKWVIVTDSDGRLYAYLKASNGEKMLATESYTSLSGIKSGIDTLKKNIEKDNYAINLDKNGNFVFKIFTGANRLLCVGEGYSTREQCEKAFASVKRFSQTAIIVVEKDEKQ